jgi:hypothetical protein
MLKKSSGLTILTSIFILLITSLSAQFLVSAARVSLSSISTILTGRRALFAARSGTEWGMTNAVNNGACPADTTINLTQTGLKDFSVFVTCVERAAGRYTVTATATYGTFGEFGYSIKTFTDRYP